MKSKNTINSRFSKFSFAGFLLFFITILLTSTASIFVYYFTTKFSHGNIFVISTYTLLIIIIGATLCTLCDIIRRKVMVENPVKTILDATEKIANGDFNINISTINAFSKYNEFDYILENISTMVKELSKNEILKNDFISNVSHEIKTPLSVIQNYAKALQKDNLPEKKKQEYLQNLIVQTNKLSTLITNILKLNKLENQAILQNNIETNIGESLRDVIIQYETKLDEKNITIECDIDDCVLCIEPSFIDIIYNNLISNAIKFTNNEGKIEISLKENKSFIEFKVKDNGCGMTKDVGSHIFEKFYQGDISRSKEGNGLGLALVKRVIDIIGGKIEIESEVNKGSTFTIKLPKDTK